MKFDLRVYDLLKVGLTTHMSKTYMNYDRYCIYQQPTTKNAVFSVHNLGRY